MTSPSSMPQNGFAPLNSESDLEQAIAHSQKEPVVLYKHSSTCGLSRSARTEMQDLAAEQSPALYEVVVQSARSVSNAIADRFGIRHESPQAIVIYQGEPTFDTSHHDVTADTVGAALEQAQQ